MFELTTNTELVNPDTNSFNIQNSFAPFFSRKRFVSKQCLHHLCNRKAHFVEWIGIPVGVIDEERGAVCFGPAFAADLSALIREFATIFRSGVAGLTVLAKVSSLSSWIRIFSVRSPTNLLSPLKILIHEWCPPLDKRFNPRSQLQAFPHGYWSPLPILDQSLYFQESILLGVDDSSSRGKVYSRHATWPSNVENSSASFVLKHCPRATVFKNLGICA